MEMILSKWKAAVSWASAKGIPIPLLRNPKHQEASVTFTMLIVSFLTCSLSLFELFKSINFEHAFELFAACSALYFGRNFQKNKLSSTQESNKISKET